MNFLFLFRLNSDFSKCGLLTDSIRTIWELIKMRSPRPSSRPTESEIWGWGLRVCVLSVFFK